MSPPVNPATLPAFLTASPAAVESADDRRIVAAAARIGAALARFGPDLPLVTIGSPAGLAVAHLIWAIDRRFEVALLDTGLGFPERRRALEDLAAQLGGNLTIRRPALSTSDQSDRYGPDLWTTSPALCCWLRQSLAVEPVLAGRPTWFRAAFGRFDLAERDRPVEDRPPIEPIHDWSRTDVQSYLERYVPAGAKFPIADDGAAGCAPCTRLRRGGDGRWRADLAPGRLSFP